MAYLIGLYLVAEGGMSRTRKMGRAAQTRSTAWFGSVRSRIGLLGEWIGDHWPTRNREDDEDDEAGPLLNEDELTAWIADITDPNLPKYREQEPKDTPDERPERSSDLAPGPREESTRAIAWADGPTRAMPAWELSAATPTELVTRRERPREEIVDHYDSEWRRSYLGPMYTPGYEPRHYAPDLEDQDDHSGQAAHAGPARGTAAPVAPGNARRPAQRGGARPASGRGRPAGDRARLVVRRDQQVHGPADRPRRRPDDHVYA